MPNRWIKESYLASSRINAVSPEARDCWVRLLLVADDYGLFHANPQLVASRCYPLQPNARKCAQLLAELEGAGLVARYEAGGRPYLRIEQWYERARSSPKYPQPGPALAGNADDLTCREQVQASASKCESPRARLITTTTITTTEPSALGRARAPPTEPAGRSRIIVLTEPSTHHRELATSMGLDCDAELAKYHDHFRANGKRHKDEEAGFRNWLKKAPDFQRNNGRPRGPTPSEKRAEVARAIFGDRAPRTDGTTDISGESTRIG